MEIQDQLKGHTAFYDYLNMIVNEMVRQGFSKEQAIQHLSPPELDNPEVNRVPFYDMVNCWHKAIDVAGSALFSLSAGANVHPADYGPLGLLVTQSKSIAEGWDLAYRHQSIVADAFPSQLIIQDDCVINQINCLGIDPEWCRPYVEHDFIALLMLVRYTTANTISGFQFTINFKHKAAAPIEQYKNIFDAEYNFETDENQIIFPREVMDLEIYSPNTNLFNMLSDEVRSLSFSQASDAEYEVKVANFVEEQILMGKPVSIGICSDNFHVSTSTLKRRLFSRATNFQRIQDAVKLTIAKNMLRNGNTKITHIARALGYSGVPQFSRFLKKHTGISPSDLRNKIDR